MQFYCYRVKFCAGTERKRQNKKKKTKQKTKQNKDKKKPPQLQKQKNNFFRNPISDRYIGIRLIQCNWNQRVVNKSLLLDILRYYLVMHFKI